MRYPVQAADTPVVTGSAVPAGVRAVVNAMKAEKDSYGMKTYESIQVHHVRIDGRDSYLVYGNAEDGVSEQMYTAAGKKLDVMF